MIYLYTTTFKNWTANYNYYFYAKQLQPLESIAESLGLRLVSVGHTVSGLQPLGLGTNTDHQDREQMQTLDPLTLHQWEEETVTNYRWFSSLSH